MLPSPYILKSPGIGQHGLLSIRRILLPQVGIKLGDGRAFLRGPAFVELRRSLPRPPPQPHSTASHRQQQCNQQPSQRVACVSPEFSKFSLVHQGISFTYNNTFRHRIRNKKNGRKCFFSNKQALAAGVLLRVSCVFVASADEVSQVL